MIRLLMTPLLLLICILAAPGIFAQDCCEGIRGNIDGDLAEEINITDLVYLVTYMFQNGPLPPCAEEADIDGSGDLDVADLVHLVTFMFQDGPPPADCPVVIPDSVIVPLAIGNQWLSHVTQYNSSGGIIDEFEASTIVTGDTVINDSTWYLVDDNAAGLGGILTNMDDGAWTYFPDSTPAAALVLRYPASAGQSYPYYSVTVNIDATNASVTVPAGTFSCYYYRLSAPIIGTVGKIWAAPNIGVIKAEQYDLDFITVYLAARVELLSYGIID